MAYIQKTEEQKEQLKDRIFRIITEYQNDASSFGKDTIIAQFWKLLIDYFDVYFSYKYKDIKVDKSEEKDLSYIPIGAELFYIAKRFLNDERINNYSSNKAGFFRQLNESVNNGINEYYRNKSSVIHIPKEKKKFVREIESIIEMKERNLGRLGTEDERRIWVTDWYGDDKKYDDYIEIKAIMNVDSQNQKNDDNEDVDLFERVESNTSNNPQDDHITQIHNTQYKKAVEAALNNKQERVRDLCRALFTLYCFDEFNDITSLESILDQEVLEACSRIETKPKQYEIYKKYRSEANDQSAGVRASETLSGLLNDIDKRLKENQ